MIWNQLITADELRACAEAGMTRTEADRHLGVTLACVSKRAKRMGLDFVRGRRGMDRRLFAQLSDAEMDDYRCVKHAMGYSRDDALRAINRADLVGSE